MNDKELKEYMRLSDKADSNMATFEELQRLHQCHTHLLRECYNLAKENQERQMDIQSILEELNGNLDDLTLNNILYAAFIEEQDLANEYKEFLDSAIEQAAEEALAPKAIN